MTSPARLVHQCAWRVRIRIAARRGDAVFFSRLYERVVERFKDFKVTVNSDTGSLLVCGTGLDAEELFAFGRENGLFAVQQGTTAPRLPVTSSLGDPVRRLNQGVRQASSGFLDLPGLIVLALVIYGIVELIKGNYKSPPWYTAFWYAFGVFSKSILDRTAS